MKLSSFDCDQAEKFFTIALNVFDRTSPECGLPVEAVRNLIANAFVVAPFGSVANQHYRLMIQAKFIYADVNGIHANPAIKKQYEDFRFKRNFEGVVVGK